MRLTVSFSQLVRDSLAAVPAAFRARLHNVVIIVEREPPGGQQLLGLCETGLPFGLPDRITIYEGPHRRASASFPALRRLVEETVIHEVGHYFGLNEREVLAMERRHRRSRQRRRLA
jgi:predicted Zn-dependent protease with MMP-like domain